MFTTGNSILRISNEDDVHKIIEFLRRFSFKDSDDKDAHEILCISIYVVALFKISRLRLPLIVEKSEAPDFRLSFNGGEKPIGLEHTRATLEQYKMADSEFKKRPAGSMMEPLYYSPFKKLPKKKVNIGIRKPNEQLKGLGSSGNNIEIEWAETIKNAIIAKTNLLNENHFQRFSTNELLIEDESPTELFKGNDVAFELLASAKKEIKPKLAPVTFDRVHIFTVNDFVYDFFNKNILIDVSKKNLLRDSELSDK